MRAHFFDLNTAITVESKVWIVSKINPNKPIIKISQSEFNLIKKGIYRRTGQSILFGSSEFFITNELFEKIKLSCKKNKVEITDLSFSMQEFINPEIINEIQYKIWK